MAKGRKEQTARRGSKHGCRCQCDSIINQRRRTRRAGGGRNRQRKRKNIPLDEPPNSQEIGTMNPLIGTDQTNQTNLTVVNLTNKRLTEAELEVLSLGLTFCPSNDLEYTQTRIDLFRFTRKLKLHKHFKMRPHLRSTKRGPKVNEMDILSAKDLPAIEALEDLRLEQDLQQEQTNLSIAQRAVLQGVEQEREESTFKPASTFVPQTPWDAIDVFTEAMKRDLTAYRKSKPSILTNNITEDQRQALKGLMNEESIIIKPSDKGGNVVLMSRELYRAEALRQLADNNYYRECTNAVYQTSIMRYDALVQKWYNQNMLGKDENLFLRNHTPMLPTFYHLPKLHKDMEKPPGRPIISSIGSLTENMSRFVDNILFPLVIKLESYIRDTKDFLTKIQELTWNSGYLLMVLDITSLYTRIDHGQGLEAIKHALGQRPMKYACHNQMILEFTEFCLTNNIFLFEDQMYIQTSGTAMGTCFAPSYANLFVGWWEEQVPRSCTAGTETGQVKSWYRYIDDLFIVWDGGMDSAEEFIRILNLNDLNLHFSGSVSPVRAEYLDLRVYIEDNQMHTTLHRKDTAGNSTLFASSSHPTPLKNSIPYGELLRIRRNCSKDSDFEAAASECIERFSMRGYGTTLLSKTLKKVRKMQRSQLLAIETPIVGRNRNSNKSEGKFRLITPYSKGAGDLKAMLTKNWNILKTDSVLADDLPAYPLITFSRARSLSDMLVSSHLKKPTPKANSLKRMAGFFPCGHCKACSGSKRVLSFEISDTGMKVPIKHFITCSSQFVVYCLVCPCGLRYIGSTIKELKLRILEHQRAIEKVDISYPVARHFAEEHSKDRKLLRFFGLDMVPPNVRGGDRLRRLRRLESRYIVDLSTKQPGGLNSGEELAYHLGK
ncbi:uncharacterized protein LOC144798546 [Lissotriton helveticus]